MKVEMKGVIRNIIINKQSFVLQDAVTHKRDQVTMVNSTYDFNFCPELTVTLTSTNFQLLYCYHRPICEASFVHSTKSTFTQKILFGKTISSLH